MPRCRLNTYGRRAFPVAGPTVWNSLQPDELRDPACDVDSFKQFFKTMGSVSTSSTSASEVIFNVMRYINLRVTYLLSSATVPLDETCGVAISSLWQAFGYIGNGLVAICNASADSSSRGSPCLIQWVISLFDLPFAEPIR